MVRTSFRTKGGIPAEKDSLNRQAIRHRPGARWRFAAKAATLCIEPGTRADESRRIESMHRRRNSEQIKASNHLREHLLFD